MKYTLTLFILILFMSCSSEEKQTITDYKQTITDYTVQNEEEILEYITANGLDAKKSNSGLYYVVNEPGADVQPTTTDNVTVAYKGYFTNGTVFDQNSGYKANLQRVIAGWTEGITYFKEGGSGILLIPAHLGYGNNPPPSIPKGAVLIFDIELISVN